MLISMATFGLKLLSSSMASSSSSSLKYCSLEVDILDCILEALVDILDCILEVLVDILDPDILVLTFAVAQTPLPHPLHYRTLGCKELLSFSPLEETPPPEVVDSFPKVVSQNREGKGCGRLTFSPQTSADAKVQSRKQTRTVMLLLQNECAASATCVPWQRKQLFWGCCIAAALQQALLCVTATVRRDSTTAQSSWIPANCWGQPSVRKCLQ